MYGNLSSNSAQREARRLEDDTLQLLTTPNILVLHNDILLNRNTGEIQPTFYLQSILRGSLVGGYICGTHLYEEVGSLNQILSDLPGWRMRSSIIPKIQRGIVGPGGKPAMRGTMRIDYVTFKTQHTHKHVREKRVKWWVFNLDAFWDDVPDTLEAKRDMAVAHLAMLHRRGVKFRPSRGGTGIALLKKSPEWVSTHDRKMRWPAPRFINEQAREVLPGNFYSVKHNHIGIPSISHCFLVDQIAAHHTIASTVPMPHPEWMHARGNHRGFLEGKKWIDRGTKAEDQLLTDHIGLVYACIQVRHIPPKMLHLYPKWAHKTGTRCVWIWTPELRLFRDDDKVKILYYVCALTSTHRDEAIREYAQWALTELELPDKKYKKGTLLSAYGVLAMNTITKTKLMYAWAGTDKVKGTPMHLPIIGDVTIRKISNKSDISQPNFLNVAARGVMEAETRTRSLEYARELEISGVEVAQIYVDALLVKTDQLPFIAPGWSISHSLTNVIIPRVNGLQADELVKLPGLPRMAAERRISARMPFPALHQREQSRQDLAVIEPE